MAGNLDATYPTKTEFKDVPVDPSAASKSSFHSHVAHRGQHCVDDCSAIRITLSLFFRVHLASSQLRQVAPLYQLSNGKTC